MVKHYPNNIGCIENYAYNLRGNSTRLNHEPASNTTLMHTANRSLILHVACGTIYLLMLGRPPILIFFLVTKLKELNQLPRPRRMSLQSLLIFLV